MQYSAECKFNPKISYRITECKYHPKDKLSNKRSVVINSYESVGFKMTPTSKRNKLFVSKTILKTIPQYGEKF